MSAKIKVELELLNKLTKPVDKARGSVKRLGLSLKTAFKGANTQLGKTIKGLGKFASGINSVLTKVINLKNLIIGAVLAGVTKFFINSAASIEVFAKQLEVVTGSAGEAKKALDAIREFARVSPLETEDVVQSYVRLRAVGIDPTLKQMRTIGGVAVLMNREMVDVLDSFIGLNKRTLRRLGIDIDRTGKKAVIQSGNIKRVVEKDTASIRKALLEVWEERFPNAIEVAAETTRAKTAIMKSNVFELSVTVGEKLKPAWDKVVVSIGKAAEATNKFLKEFKIKGLKEANKQLEADLKNSIKSLSELTFKQKTRFLFSKGLVITEEQQKRITDKILKNKKEILKLEKESKIAKELGAGTLGPPKGDKKDVTESELKRKRFEKIKILKEAKNTEIEFNDAISASNLKRGMEEFDDAIERGLIARKSLDFKLQRSEEEFNMEKDFVERRQKLRDEEKIEREKAADDKKRETDILINQSIRLATVTGNIAEMAIRKSKIRGQKKKALLRALAIIDIGSAAIRGVNAAMELPFPGNVVAAAATVAEVIALTASSMAAISNTKLARGTGFAAGGTSVVGEEGPELVNIPRGARVSTSAQTRQILNNNVSPTIIIQGNASESTVISLRGELERFGNMFSDARRFGFIPA